MSGWSAHTGTAICLPVDNIDTDQLIPARFMSRPRIDGYGDFLLHDMRRQKDEQPDPDFVLHRYPGASVLVAGRNFGSGSSREAAVYALVDAGFRAVIATSFGDIFAANAVNNGLLPARVSDESLESLFQRADGRSLQISIDIEAGRIDSESLSVPFELDHIWREKLINGWDDVDLTRLHQSSIAQYREQRALNAPWLWPSLESHPKG